MLRHTSLEALGHFLDGLRSAAGGPTPPLESDCGGRFRSRELLTGIGSKDDVSDRR
ncbi:MAG: hypothetical protein M3503_01850 [Actinomycetota bacterium]|nr:hypothetical protein [Actinomycetota bacterium]